MSYIVKENILEIKSLSKSYTKGVKNKKQIKALDKFSALLTPGIYALLGPNGAGKSTLINIITRNIIADSGTVLYNGKGIIGLGKNYLCDLGYMPQQQVFYESFTGAEFLVYISALKGIPKNKCSQSVKKAVENVNMQNHINKKIGAYSGGMRQRLLLASALLGDPKILIMDEPTVGLDPQERDRFKALIANLANKNIVLIATHLVSDIENIATDIILMNEGKLLAYDSPENMLKEFSDCDNLEQVYLQVFGAGDSLCD